MKRDGVQRLVEIWFGTQFEVKKIVFVFKLTSVLILTTFEFFPFLCDLSFFTANKFTSLHVYPNHLKSDN